jgi:26S proteasome regulatory subunit N10
MVCFVGSTIREDIETLKILAKKLKKNAVAVDLVVFGDLSEEQINKAQTFVSTIQNDDNSHCLIVEPGEILTDKLIGSPIVGGAAGQGAAQFDNIEADDPELAAAIRASLEEAQQAQPQPQQQAPPAVQAPQPSAQHQPEANYHEPTEE